MADPSERAPARTKTPSPERWEGKAVTGQPIIKRDDRIRYEEIAEDLKQHYATSGDRDLKEAEVRLTPLGKCFAGRRVVDLDGAQAARYVEHRQAAGRANGTINRELATLIRMIGFACENKKLLHMPIIHKLTEAKPRAGFFEPPQFEAVRRRLRQDLQAAITIAYVYGSGACRVKSWLFDSTSWIWTGVRSVLNHARQRTSKGEESISHRSFAPSSRHKSSASGPCLGGLTA